MMRLASGMFFATPRRRFAVDFADNGIVPSLSGMY
jgi:hypothetical protein